ncbi:permease [Legionella jordanis]|uniref:Probable membrane transporter protein n=2 Tax=Legionella jordanis TaxID=456 RepID=A0A0W0VCI3_9GAMM|nr:sulfite exporter TauE/SafE family protein [Legionella jordanis]KTD17800.1 permease [Legionella jordanis]VEH11263.1 permease [Legionella jordanis]
MLALAMSGGLYAVTGCLAGFLAGVLGIGGGIILVPALVFIFQHNPDIPSHLVMHLAAGSSLAVMFLTSQSSIRAHHQLNGISWDVFRLLWPGLALGSISGVLCANFLSRGLLQGILALFLLFVAGRMIFNPAFSSTEPAFPRLWINRSISFSIGFISGLLGIGGGTLVIPYLQYCGVELRKTIALSALATMTIALVGMLASVMTGWSEEGLPSYSTGYVYWPAVISLALLSSIFAPLGAKMAYLIPTKQLKYGFVILLLIVALDLMV